MYEDALLTQHVVSTIAAHDPSTPLFMFWAPHAVHEPLECPQVRRRGGGACRGVPLDFPAFHVDAATAAAPLLLQAYLDAFSFIALELRQYYCAMVSYLDDQARKWGERRAGEEKGRPGSIS